MCLIFFLLFFIVYICIFDAIIFIYFRACGFIFCSTCAKAQAPLAYEKNKKLRVCDYCYDHMFNTYRSAPPDLTK